MGIDLRAFRQRQQPCELISQSGIWKYLSFVREFLSFFAQNQLPKYGVKAVTRPGGGSIHAGGAGTRERLHAKNATNPLQSGDPPDIISLSTNDTRNWYRDSSKASTTLQEVTFFPPQGGLMSGDGHEQSRDRCHFVANVCNGLGAVYRQGLLPARSSQLEE